MGRKVFVSYKYSDAWKTRDQIIDALRGDGSYYKGEMGYKPLDYADATLKQYLGAKIFDSTVTVVIISPYVIQSKWVEWEIRYSLETHTRNDRTSGRNGIVCVIQKQKDYLSPKYDGSGFNENSNWAYIKIGESKVLNKSVLPSLIWRNMKDSFGEYDKYSRFILREESNIQQKDYCVIVAESTFLANPSKYLEEAYRRAIDDVNYKTETR